VKPLSLARLANLKMAFEVDETSEAILFSTISLRLMCHCPGTSVSAHVESQSQCRVRGALEPAARSSFA